MLLLLLYISSGLVTLFIGFERAFKKKVYTTLDECT